MVPQVRKRFGGRLSDEEVLLRIMFPEEHVEAVLAAPPLEASPLRAGTPLLDLVREVLGRRRSGAVSIRADGMAVSVRFPMSAEGAKRPNRRTEVNRGQ